MRIMNLSIFDTELVNRIGYPVKSGGRSLTFCNGNVYLMHGIVQFLSKDQHGLPTKLFNAFVKRMIKEPVIIDIASLFLCFIPRYFYSPSHFKDYMEKAWEEVRRDNEQLNKCFSDKYRKEEEVFNDMKFMGDQCLKWIYINGNLGKEHTERELMIELLESYQYLVIDGNLENGEAQKVADLKKGESGRTTATTELATRGSACSKAQRKV